jgi:hypothetical protein
MGDSVDQVLMEKIRGCVAELAAMDYPKVWVGKPGITVEELLRIQNWNAEGPEWMRIEPGNDPDLGDLVPDVSVDWLDGLWVMENMRDELPEPLEAELYREVLYTYAAKRGEVPLIRDSRERYEASLPPEIWRVPVDALTSDDLRFVRMEEIEFYASGETMGPYVIPDSEQARTAVEDRLRG